MVNEYKAHSSFILKVIITLIGYWTASILAIIIYSMFFKIGINIFLLCLLLPTPVIWFNILIGMGLTYRYMENLTVYDKHKLWCVFVRDLTLTILATILATLTTMELYQIEHPLKPIEFVFIVGLVLIVGFTIITTLIIKYLKIIKNLKKISKN